MTDTGAQKPALRKPEFIKIKDLERGRSGYNVFVKVVKCEERTVDTRDGHKIRMVDAVVADETGSSNAFFKGDNAKDIKEGVTIAIRNGVKKIIKGHISLELDIFGRVTVEDVKINPNNELNISTEEIKLEPRRNDNRNRNRTNNRGGPRNNFRDGGRRNNQSRNDRGDNRGNRNESRAPRNREDRPARRNDRNEGRGDRNEGRGERNEGRGERKPRNNDRDYDRRNNNRNEGREYTEKPRNNDRKFQEKRGDRKPMIKINEIGPGEENLRFIAKIVSATLVQGKNGNNMRCVLGDETGTVNAFIPEVDCIEVGKTVALFGAEARVVKQHIEIQKARAEPARNPINNVKDSFSISEKAWVPVD